MKRVLITGGYGYIGGQLAQSFLNDGWHVTILDTRHAAKPWNLTAWHDQLYVISLSVCNADAVARAMADVSLVYHLADRLDWERGPKYAIRKFDVCTTGTVNVLGAAQQAGVDNVVFASSAAVYGNVVGAEESGPTNPVTLHGCAKLAAEQACRHFYNEGLNIKALRLFNVWGGPYSGSVVGKFIAGNAVIYGDGGQTRDFVYVSDVVAALRMAAEWDPLLYNIGTGTEITLNGLWCMVRGNDKPVYGHPAYGYAEIERSCADMTATFARTDWRPKIDLASLGAEEIIKLCH